MSGSSYGKQFTITTWGESHGEALGVVVDGCPAGLTLSPEDVQIFLDRRKPGANPYGTPRPEADAVEILSGIFEGKTTGTPISMMVRNTSQHSGDYSEIASYYRPGHADYPYDVKYGFRDYRGGGRASGRETVGRVAAGAVAMRILKTMDIRVRAYTEAIGPVRIDPSRFNEDDMWNNPFYMPDAEAAKEAAAYVDKMREAGDSVGGICACVVKGMPAGIGSPVFDKLDADLAKALMSIGGVKGVEIGDGMDVSSSLGSENNDAFVMEQGKVSKETNHAGGILGGLSDGTEIRLRAAFKGTPSISKQQKTVNQQGEEIEISVKGRHDPVIVPRAVVVVEAMTALTILDALFANMTSRLDKIVAFYER